MMKQPFYFTSKEHKKTKHIGMQVALTLDENKFDIVLRCLI